MLALSASGMRPSEVRQALAKFIWRPSAKRMDSGKKKWLIPCLVAGIVLLVALAFYFRRNILALVGLALLALVLFRKWRSAAKPADKADKADKASGKPPSDKPEPDAGDEAGPPSTQLLQRSSQTYPVKAEVVDQVRHDMFDPHDGIKANLSEEPGKYNQTYIDNPPHVAPAKQQDFARELAKDLTHHKDQYLQEVVEEVVEEEEEEEGEEEEAEVEEAER